MTKYLLGMLAMVPLMINGMEQGQKTQSSQTHPIDKAKSNFDWVSYFGFEDDQDDISGERLKRDFKQLSILPGNTGLSKVYCGSRFKIIDASGKEIVIEFCAIERSSGDSKPTKRTVILFKNN